jgi:hypothetical protein
MHANGLECAKRSHAFLVMTIGGPVEQALTRVGFAVSRFSIDAVRVCVQASTSSLNETVSKIGSSCSGSEREVAAALLDGSDPAKHY